jgi:hypothetical protein
MTFQHIVATGARETTAAKTLDDGDCPVQIIDNLFRVRRSIKPAWQPPKICWHPSLFSSRRCVPKTSSSDDIWLRGWNYLFLRQDALIL